MTKNNNNEGFNNTIKDVLSKDLTKKNIEVHYKLKRNITKLNNQVSVDFNEAQRKNEKETNKLKENIFNLLEIINEIMDGITDDVSYKKENEILILDKKYYESIELRFKLLEIIRKLGIIAEEIIKILNKNKNLREGTMLETDGVEITNKQKKVFIELMKNSFTLYKDIIPERNKKYFEELMVLEDLNKKVLNIVELLNLINQIKDEKMLIIDNTYIENVKLIKEIEGNILCLNRIGTDVYNRLYRIIDLLKKI